MKLIMKLFIFELTTIFNLFNIFYDKESFENIIDNVKKKTEINNANFYNIKAERIPVIVYHRIVNDWEQRKEKNNLYHFLVISRSEFKNQMKWLKKRKYMTLNCKELYLWHQGKIELPKKSVLITFDGGTIGQSKYALPILKKYKTL